MDCAFNGINVIADGTAIFIVSLESSHTFETSLASVPDVSFERFVCLPSLQTRTVVLQVVCSFVILFAAFHV